MITDVTAEVEAQESLDLARAEHLAAVARFERVVELANDLILAFDVEGRDPLREPCRGGPARVLGRRAARRRLVAARRARRPRRDPAAQRLGLRLADGEADGDPVSDTRRAHALRLLVGSVRPRGSPDVLRRSRRDGRDRCARRDRAALAHRRADRPLQQAPRRRLADGGARTVPPRWPRARRADARPRPLQVRQRPLPARGRRRRAPSGRTEAAIRRPLLRRRGSLGRRGVHRRRSRRDQRQGAQAHSRVGASRGGQVPHPPAGRPSDPRDDVDRRRARRGVALVGGGARRRGRSRALRSEASGPRPGQARRRAHGRGDRRGGAGGAAPRAGPRVLRQRTRGHPRGARPRGRGSRRSDRRGARAHRGRRAALPPWRLAARHREDRHARRDARRSRGRSTTRSGR